MYNPRGGRATLSLKLSLDVKGIQPGMAAQLTYENEVNLKTNQVKKGL
jgi:hypothetical protein